MAKATKTNHALTLDKHGNVMKDGEIVGKIYFDDLFIFEYTAEGRKITSHDLDNILKEYGIIIK